MEIQPKGYRRTTGDKQKEREGGGLGWKILVPEKQYERFHNYFFRRKVIIIFFNLNLKKIKVLLLHLLSFYSGKEHKHNIFNPLCENLLQKETLQKLKLQRKIFQNCKLGKIAKLKKLFAHLILMYYVRMYVNCIGMFCILRRTRPFKRESLHVADKQ